MVPAAGPDAGDTPCGGDLLARLAAGDRDPAAGAAGVAHAVVSWRDCFTLWLALASPIDPMGQFLLTAHMTQHLILMSIAPPLMILGAPQVPLLRGLPRGWFAMAWRSGSPEAGALAAAILYASDLWLDRDERRVCRRGTCRPPMSSRCGRTIGTTSSTYASFVPALSLWWTVLQPWPSKPLWTRWMIPIYLAAADIVNTGGLGAARLRRSSRVPDLYQCAAHLRHQRHDRPGDRGLGHVGHRVVDLADPALR